LRIFLHFLDRVLTLYTYLCNRPMPLFLAINCTNNPY
jgi:hypothetical protein